MTRISKYKTKKKWGVRNRKKRKITAAVEMSIRLRVCVGCVYVRVTVSLPAFNPMRNKIGECTQSHTHTHTQCAYVPCY